MATDQLANIPLFKDLTVEERLELSGMLHSRHFDAQQTVFWLGERGDEFFLVKTGQLTASCPDENGKEVILGTLGPGNFFGEISLLDGGPRSATIRALAHSDLMALKRQDFLQFLLDHPDAAIHMLTVLGQRQRETLEKVRGIRNANEAIAQSRTSWNRIAEKVATMSASRAFVTLNLVIFSSWITINLVLGRLHHPHLRPWDEGPNFSVLGFIGTVEALFITLFVLISQGLQGERDRIRADLDYQVNLKAHQEVMQLHQKIDRLAAVVGQSVATSAAPDAATPIAMTPVAETPFAVAPDSVVPDSAAPETPKAAKQD